MAVVRLIRGRKYVGNADGYKFEVISWNTKSGLYKIKEMNGTIRENVMLNASDYTEVPVEHISTCNNPRSIWDSNNHQTFIKFKDIPEEKRIDFYGLLNNDYLEKNGRKEEYRPAKKWIDSYLIDSSTVAPQEYTVTEMQNNVDSVLAVL